MGLFRYIVGKDDPRNRLDLFILAKSSDLSRSYIQKLISQGHVSVNGKLSKSNHSLREGDHVRVNVPDAVAVELMPVDVPLRILGETADYVVVDKPAGMAVHPGVHGAHVDDSLVNALLFHCKGKLSGINGVLRPGIVHRLDKDTSGVIVVAKNDKAHRWLAAQFAERKVEKAYFALLAGRISPSKGSIDAPIGRDPHDRKKMGVSSSGKEAVTHYQVQKYYDGYSYVKVTIKTGRTHQIRVHFSSIGFPIVGDPLYGKISVNKKFIQKFGLKRQFLHAGVLAFDDPGTKKRAEFMSPLPSDLQSVLDGIDS